MASDYFLKIEGIKGESTDSKHKDEIEVESFEFGVTNIGTGGRGGGHGSGKASFKDISFVKRADTASPTLMVKCAKGEHIKKAMLTVRKAGGTQQDYYKVELTDLMISSFHNSGSDTDSVPLEHVSLNFSKIEFYYSPQSADGSLGAKTHGGYDLKENRSV